MNGGVFRKTLLLKISQIEYCEIFKKTYFEKHLRTTASEFWLAFSDRGFNYPVLNTKFSNNTFNKNGSF